MNMKTNFGHYSSGAVPNLIAALVMVLISGCSHIGNLYQNVFHGTPPAPAQREKSDFTYHIGPGDTLNIFVWRNPELTTTVPVRPDGKFSTPLVDDLQASGKTTSELARDIEKVLSEYIRDPLVTVTVGGFVGEYDEQVRVVGQASKPTALPYRKGMTALDVMIMVGGLTDYAAGNRATIVRTKGQERQEYRVRLEDLVRDGDIRANVEMQPGDILIIPESWF